MHAPKTESFTMPYHPHEFIKFERDNGWQCNGASIFGKCKSGLIFNFSYYINIIYQYLINLKNN